MSTETSDRVRILRFIGLMNYIYRDDLDPDMQEVLDELVDSGEVTMSDELEGAYMLGKSYHNLRKI